MKRSKRKKKRKKKEEMIGEEGQKENEKMKGRGKKGREGGASCGEKAMQQSEVQNVVLREYLRKEGCATWVIC